MKLFADTYSLFLLEEEKCKWLRTSVISIPMENHFLSAGLGTYRQRGKKTNILNLFTNKYTETKWNMAQMSFNNKTIKPSSSSKPAFYFSVKSWGSFW